MLYHLGFFFLFSSDLNNLGQHVLLKGHGLICKQQVTFSCGHCMQITLELFQKKKKGGLKKSKVILCSTESPQPGTLFLNTLLLTHPLNPKSSAPSLQRYLQYLSACCLVWQTLSTHKCWMVSTGFMAKI